MYGGTLVVFYLAPIPAVAALVATGERGDRSTLQIFTTGMAMLAAMYPFAVRLMPTSPDFGGNLFVSLGLLCAGAAFARLLSATEGPSVRPMMLTILGFLAALFLSVVFRRWYAFDAFGLLASFSVAMLILAACRGRKFASWTLKSLVLAGAIFGVALSPILLPKLLVVSSAGIFEGAYDAYRSDYLFTFGRFGYAELSVIFLFASAALFVSPAQYRIFVFFAVAGNIIGIMLFLFIQAPGIHHFSLLWPMILVSVSVVVDRLFHSTNLPLSPATVAAGLVGLSGAVVAAEFPYKVEVDRHIAGYQLVAGQIIENRIENRRFCVLGSEDIYLSVIDNLWQIKGGRRGALPLGVRVPEVDFGLADRYGAGGALGRTISSCDWIITMEHLRLHHEAKFHRILRYHHEKIFDPTSVLGGAYEIDERLDAGFGNPVIFFKRKAGAVVPVDAFKVDYLTWLAKDKAALP